MKNNFLKIFLILTFNFFFIGNCLAAALEAPSELNVPEETIGEGSVILEWFWDGDYSDIKQFKMLWRTAGSSEEWKAKYPSAAEEEGPNFQYSLRGLVGDTGYEWRIKAEAQNPADDSPYRDGDPFTTKAPVWDEPEDVGGEGTEDTSITISSIFENIGNLQEAADALMNFLVAVGFAVGPILIIWASFVLLTKQGNPESIAQAQKIIFLTIIALSIMLFAKGVPSVVQDLFK